MGPSIDAPFEQPVVLRRLASRARPKSTGEGLNEHPFGTRVRSVITDM